MRKRRCPRWKRIWRGKGCGGLGGNGIPEFAFRLGHSFPLVLYTESASRNGRPNWDALSIAEDMRPRSSCSAYVYACCQVSKSSLAAA